MDKTLDPETAQIIGGLAANMQRVLETLQEMKTSIVYRSEHADLVRRVETLEKRPERRHAIIVGVIGSVVGIIGITIAGISLVHGW